MKDLTKLCTVVEEENLIVRQQARYVCGCENQTIRSATEEKNPYSIPSRQVGR